MFGDDVDHVVVQLGDVTGADVVPPAMRKAGIEHRLMNQVRLGPAEVEQRLPEGLQGTHDPCPVFHGAGVAGGHGDHMLSNHLGGHDGECRGSPLHGDCHQLIRAVGDPVAVEAEHLGAS